jgi:glycosyltransferase involved in cell wall biosynthesis
VKIGYNAQIISRSGAGIVNFARNVIQHLVQVQSDHEFFIYGNPAFLSHLESHHAHIVPTNPFVDNSSKRIIWEQCVLPFKISRNNLDLMLYPDHTAPIFKKSCPVVITLHDIAFISFPDTFTSATRLYKEYAVKQSVKRASRIIAVSEFTKLEVMKFLDVPESKLTVIYRGIDERFQENSNEVQLSSIRTKYDLQNKFILFVGTLEPRKNIQKLIQGYAGLLKQKKIPHDLIIVGGQGWLFKDIYGMIEKLGVQNSVKLLGYVADTDLPLLYNLADVFVYPSLYEGFGLPPLEAMACGCPVVTSNRSSLPEIVGDAAMLVDPYDSDAIANGIFQVIDNKDYRQLLRKQGLQRASQFTWKRTVAEILKIFDAITNEDH